MLQTSWFPTWSSTTWKVHSSFSKDSTRTKRLSECSARRRRWISKHNHSGQQTYPLNVGSISNATDPYVYTKMDQLQNQLNQVLLMVQIQNINEFNVVHLSHMAGKYIFIASFSSGVKEIWVIDNGATNHIYTCISLMFDLHKCIQPIIVHLPNGHTTKVTLTGSVKINPNLTLKNVLYIPSFTYNLISISRITNTTHSSVTFTHNKCIFQGLDG